jgi:hypothetical protein
MPLNASILCFQTAPIYQILLMKTFAVDELVKDQIIFVAEATSQ